MAEVDVLYAKIIDENRRSDIAAKKIEAAARDLRDEGRLDLARALVGCALRGTSFMPHLKKQLTEFRDSELDPDED